MMEEQNYEFSAEELQRIEEALKSFSA